MGDMLAASLVSLSLLCAGLLAGEEVTIRYGVRGPLANLDTAPQIRLRQALIRRLRVLVPSLFALTFLSGVAATMFGGRGAGFGLRGGALLALAVFIITTLAGTVPINKAAMDWDADAPPDTWRALVKRWEQLDTVRTWLALAAFVLFLIAAAVR
jgi:uncharacterized membrane protein